MDKDSLHYHREARAFLRMARAYAGYDRAQRVRYQERAADYRQCLVYRMLRRQGLSLAAIVARQAI